MIKKHADNSFTICNEKPDPFLTVMKAMQEKHQKELRRQERLFSKDKDNKSE